MIARRIGPYELHRTLGRGGMGEVWLATRTDEGDARKLAVKVISGAQDDPAERRRLRRERQLLARLAHPRIATLLDAGETAAGAPYFVMEYVEGAPIDVYCSEHRLSLRERVALVRESCEAVAEAHRHLIIHCDLKPANILVGADGRPKLLDFGIARMLESDAHRGATRSLASLELTPDYASPELLRGEAVGVETDVYSLGVLLYRLCTGTLPIDAAELSGAARRRKLLSESTRPPERVVDDGHARELRTSRSSLQRELSGDLGAILGKALAPEPVERYASAAALASDLKAYVEGETIQARAPSPWTRTRRWLRRHRAAVSVVSAFFLVLTGWMAAAMVEFQGARKNRSESAVLVDSAQERAATAQRAFDAARRLADVQRLETLERRVLELWPLDEALVENMDSWLVDASQLVGRKSEYEAALATLPSPPAEMAGLPDMVEAAWRRSILTRLLAGITQFEESDEKRFGTISEMRRRRTASATRRQRSLVDAREEWSFVDEDLTLSGRYVLDSFPPQVGLVPLGSDFESELLEFAVLDTGLVPERDPDTGALAVDEESAIVLVLVPEGAHPRLADERIGPLLVSKYEVTQAQWYRWTGERPSAYTEALPTIERSDFHPVERVSYVQSQEVLARYGLRLPDEDEWTHAYRGGTTSRWWCGDDPSSIAEFQAGNVSDQYALEHGPGNFGFYEPWNDGHVAHAPIGEFTPNDFGLHDMLGNIQEWCTRTAFWNHENEDDATGTAPILQATAGGSYQTSSTLGAGVEHQLYPAEGAEPDIGLRPVWAGPAR